MGNSIYLGGGIKSAFCGGNVKEIWQGTNKLFPSGGSADISNYLYLTYFDRTEEIDGVVYDKPLKGRSGLKNQFFSFTQQTTTILKDAKKPYRVCTALFSNRSSDNVMFTEASNKFTFEAFVKRNGLNRSARILVVNIGGYEIHPWNYYCPYRKAADGRELYDTGHPFNPKYIEDWVHIAVLYDGETKKISHYGNGKLIATNTDVGNILGSTIGVWPYNGEAYSVTGISVYNGLKVPIDNPTFPVPTKRYDEI